MSPRPVTNPAREALAFRLWREGKAAGWDCSAADLARATGINRGVAWKIIRERGWPVRDDTHAPLGRAIQLHARDEADQPLDAILSHPRTARRALAHIDLDGDEICLWT